MDSLTHPHLIELAQFASDISETARRLSAELSPAQLRWRPTPEEWSIADCFDHLISTGYLYYPRLSDAVDAADRSQTEAAYEPSVLAKMFIWTVSPDAGIKVRAFEPFEPKHVGEDVTIMDMFSDQQAELMDLITRADEVNLNSGKFTTPGLVRLTVGEGLTMVVQHERRHLHQVESLLGDPRFPSSGS